MGQGELLAEDLSLGEALRDMGMRQITDASDPSDVERVDTVIREWAARGREFSLNDLRGDLGQNFGNLVGARVRYAADHDLISDTGRRVRSTLPSTRGHELKIWIGAS